MGPPWHPCEQRCESTIPVALGITRKWPPRWRWLVENDVAVGDGHCDHIGRTRRTFPLGRRKEVRFKRSTSGLRRRSRHWECVVMLPIAMLMWGAILQVGAVEDGVERPEWISLVDGNREAKPIAEVFRSGEVLQMYHIQATAELYEQGGLNHDMSFSLTAVAFYSMERPEVKVSMAYHPTNMTISLLPVISEDGRELHWDHQAASASYVMDLDQAYWTGASYMGETTGAFFSYAAEFTLDYHREHPRYQPFSVYEDYPGHAFLKASSCDEYVWALLFAAQERGVGLTPAIMPQKYKIVIYSHTAPEHIVIDSTGGDPAAGSGTGGAEGGNNSSATDSYSSAALTSWLSSSTEGEQAVEDESKEAGGERGDGDGSSGEASADDGTTGGGGGGGDTRRLWTAFQGIEGTPASSSLPLESSSGGDDDRGGAGGLNATEAGVEHEDPAGRTTVPDSEGHDEDGGDESNGAAAAALVTLQPTEVPVALDDWQQVVAYYQSLQLCLQERKFSFVTSLKDFAQYFDCLDDVAFISIGPHEYYKVNLTSTKLDHISHPEELPEAERPEAGFTWVDTLLAIWILMIFACGVHGMLWQAAVMQHWIKASGCGPVEDSSADECPPEEHPSFSRKITTEYLRLGERFLGTPEEFSFPEDNAADSNNSTATVAGNALLPSPSTRSSAIDTGASKRVGVIRGREHVADVRDSGSDLEAGVWLGRSQKSRKSGGYQGVSGVSNGDEEEAGLEMREAWPATTMEDQTGSFVGGRGDGRVLAMSPSARRAKSPPPPSLPPEPRPRRRVGSPAAREAEARLSSRNKRSDGYSAGGRWVEYAGSPRGGQPAQSGGARKNVGSDDVESDGNDEGSPTALLSGVPRSDEASHDLSPEAVVDHGDQNEEGGKEESKGLVVKAAPSVQRRDRSASPSSR